MKRVILLDWVISGAHPKESATTLYVCHGVFTERSIFSLNLPPIHLQSKI